MELILLSGFFFETLKYFFFLTAIAITIIQNLNYLPKNQRISEDIENKKDGISS